MVVKHHWVILLAVILTAFYVFLFFLGIKGLVGEIMMGMFLLSMLMAFISLNAVRKEGADKISPWKFLSLIVLIIAILFSSGIIYSHFPTLAALSSAGSYSSSFVLPLIVMVTIIFMALESTGLMGKSLIPNGYDAFEVEDAIYSFNRSVIFIGLLSTGISMAFILLVVTIPSFDIGLIPAIVVFVSVYFLVIYWILKRES